MSSASAGRSPHTLYRGFVPGSHWETSIPQTPFCRVKKSLNYTMTYGYLPVLRRYRYS